MARPGIKTAKQVVSLKSNGFERADQRLGGRRPQNQRLENPWRPADPNAPKSSKRISDEIRAVLDSEIPDGILYAINAARLKKKESAFAVGTTFREAVAAQLVVRALDGDVTAIREVADRDEGRPMQRVALNSNESKEIVIRVVEERGSYQDDDQVIEAEARELTDGAPGG